MIHKARIAIQVIMEIKATPSPHEGRLSGANPHKKMGVHAAVDVIATIMKNGSCHQPVFPMSWSRLDVREIVGMTIASEITKETNCPMTGMIPIRPLTAANPWNHQYSDRRARPLNVK
tara:strand:- start:34 stop:387 length:354 start_codon:yes stop_codon:yes gene_type:complete